MESKSKYFILSYFTENFITKSDLLHVWFTKLCWYILPLQAILQPKFLTKNQVLWFLWTHFTRKKIPRQVHSSQVCHAFQNRRSSFFRKLFQTFFKRIKMNTHLTSLVISIVMLNPSYPNFFIFIQLWLVVFRVLFSLSTWYEFTFFWLHWQLIVHNFFS